jgi:hypothetical protein
VVVTSVGGTNTDNGLYKYEEVPTVSNVSPSTGTTQGGTVVQIVGTGFVPGETTVSIGGKPCTNVNVISDIVLTCTAPAGDPETTVPVSVTTNGGTSNTDQTFTFHDDPQMLATLPASGPTTGGGALTIHGLNIKGATTVSIDGNDCPVLSTSYTAVTCGDIPPGTPGPKDVTMTVDTTISPIAPYVLTTMTVNANTTTITAKTTNLTNRANLTTLDDADDSADDDTSASDDTDSDDTDDTDDNTDNSNLITLLLPGAYTYYEVDEGQSPGAPGAGVATKRNDKTVVAVVPVALIVLSAAYVLRRRYHRTIRY